MSESKQVTGRRSSRMLASGLGVAVVAVLPGPAVAAEPTRQTAVQVGVRSTAPCPSGMVLQGLFDVTRDLTTYYDQAGAPVRRLSVNRAGGGGVAIGAAGLQVFDASGQLVAHFGPDSDIERAQLCQALGA